MVVNREVEEGAVPEPQGQVSPSIDESTKQLLGDLGGKYAALEKELRGLQGRQDKAENTFKSQFAEYDKLIKKGMSHDEAVETLESKQRESSTLAELQKQIADLAAHVKGNGNAPSASQEVVQAFADLGLDTKDPAVIIEMQKYKGIDDAVTAAYKLKKSMSTIPKPTASQEPSLSGTVTKVDVSAKIERLRALQKTPTKNGAEIAKLTAELDALNWGG